MARQLLLSDVPATLLKLTTDDDNTVKVNITSYDSFLDITDL